jgi:hypothetical protein
MTDHIIEVIELALAVENTSGLPSPDHYRGLACRIRAAVTPLIRAEALEEAAQVAENHPWGCPQIGTAIRALRDKS